MSRYIFLSPHLDDIVLSCGAIVDHLQSKGHETEIWTFFAGDPPPGEFSPFAISLHERWQLPDNPVLVRRNEDAAACKILNTAYKHFDMPDCIYRSNGNVNPLITKEEDLYQPIPAPQSIWVDTLVQILKSLPPETRLVSPLSIGNHVDHRIVRAAVDQLQHPNVLFYIDYPYTLKSKENIEQFIHPDWTQIHYKITPLNLEHWIEAIQCHTSQISTFWKNEAELTQEILKYADDGGGKSLWIPDKTISSL